MPRLLVPLLFLSGCLATTRYRPDQLPAEGIPVTEGQVTLIEKNGDELRYAAPAKAAYADGRVRVERDAAEVVLVPRDTMAWVDITAPSASQTAGTIVGVSLAVIVAVGLTFFVAAEIVTGGAIAGASQ